jgi:hypothetical protein
MRLCLVVAAGLMAACFGRISLAGDFLVPAATTETSPITLAGGGDTLTVEAGGTLSVDLGDAAVTATGDDFLITNEGTIDYLDYVNGAIWVSASEGGVIRNQATGVISSTISGIFAESSRLSIFNEGSITSETGVLLVLAEADIINSGSIEASDIAISVLLGAATIDNSGTLAGAQAINVSLGTLDLFNLGLIEGLEYGVRLFDSTASSFVNTGLIRGGEDGVHLHGSDLTGSNSGTIEGGLIGFNVHDGSTLDFENSGTIRGDSLYGLQFYDELPAETTVARLTNSGAISGGEAGVHIENAEVTLINTGSITGGSYGIHQTGTDSLTLANAGRITGSDYSLSLEGSGNSVTLLAGSVLDGAIHIASADNSLAFGKGLNVLLTLDDTSALPASVDTNGMPYIADSTNNRIAVVDATGFALADEMLDDLTSSVLNVVAMRTAAKDGAGDLAFVLPSGEIILAAGDQVKNDGALWGKVFGRWRDQEAGSHSWSADHRLGGFVAGIDGSPWRRMRGGVFAGAASGALAVDDDAQDITTTSLYGGIHVNRESTLGFAHMALLAGWQENDSRRHIANNSVAGGLETAQAHFDALFVAPEITVGRQAGALLTSFSARYAGLFTEAYREEGSSADLSVAARDLHGLSAQLQLSLPEIINLAGGGSLLVEPRIGLSGRIGLGGENIAAEVLGIDIPSFDPDEDDPILSFSSGAAAVAQSASGRARLKFSADLSFGTDGSLTLAAGLSGAIGF